MKRFLITVLIQTAVVLDFAGAQTMDVYLKGGQKQSFNLSTIDSITFLSEVLYAEDFSTGATGWTKIAGPGVLEVVNGRFMHTTVADSAWCEYAYSDRKFGNGRYELDVYVDSTAQCTAFSWRAPGLNQLANNDGSYTALFNKSRISPGAAGGFILHKHDPVGGDIVLMEIANHLYGLNHLIIEDNGTSVTVTINGTKHGPVNVSAFTAVAPGYIFLTGGDLGGGDYFDNIVVK